MTSQARVAVWPRVEAAQRVAAWAEAAARQAVVARALSFASPLTRSRLALGTQVRRARSMDRSWEGA